MLTVQDSFHRMGEENAFAVLARAEALKAKGKSIINLGIGQPDFRTPEHIVEAAIKALRDGAHSYTPAMGIPALREAVAEDLGKRHGAKFDPGRVLIVPGGKVTMYFAIQLFGGAGTEIIFPDPGFPIYKSMIDAVGAKAVPLPIREANDFAFSAEELLALITDKTRLIIVNSPANPTGGVTPRAEIEKLVRGLAAWPKVAVLSDEIYSEMLVGGGDHVSLSEFPELNDRLVLLDGFSKTYAMTGWRLGYSYWPKDLFPFVLRAAINSYSCVNAAAQWAGVAALEGKGEAEAAMMRAFARRRALVVAGLNKIEGVSCIMPQGAFYAFPNIKALNRPAKELTRELLETYGVALIGGPDFGAEGEGYLRLSYAASEEALEDGLARMKNFFER